MTDRSTSLAFHKQLLLPLLLISFGAAAAEQDDDSVTRILVTFNDELGNRSAAVSSPGRYYRYRARYRVSSAVRHAAKTVAVEYGMTAVDDWPIQSLDVYCVVYELAQNTALSEVIDKLGRDPRVESVQAMHRFHSMAAANSGYNDSYASFQHGLKSMNVSEAHAFANGVGVKIAVIDTRIDLQHEDLSSREIRLREFVPSRHSSVSTAHGTAVVSLIAANPNNGKGIVGIAPGADLVALSACWSDSNSETAQCNSFTLAKALDYLVQSPPDLINLSIAGPYDALLGRLIVKAVENGTVIVAALPNSQGTDDVYPASYPGVLAIGAARNADAATGQRDTLHKLFAPGNQIMVALPNDDYDFRSGSSLAAANASGVVALLLERAPGLETERIASILKKSQAGSRSGYLVINACRALLEINAADSCP